MGTGPKGSVFGEQSFYGKTRDTRIGDRHVAKRSSDPPGSLPRSQSSGTRDAVRVVGIVAPFAHGWPVLGENSFYQAPAGKWAQETCAGFPSSGTPRESQAKFRGGTV